MREEGVAPNRPEHLFGLKKLGKQDELHNPKHVNYAIKSTYQVSNDDMAKHNKLFRRACELANVQPTRRQASRWRNRRGRAYAKRHDAVKTLGSGDE